jgi:hypothetical protein
MKVSDVLKSYRAGNRDFRRANLRGQSFQGKNLAKADFSGADFSEANIRGANFNDAKFVGTKFVSAEAGLQKRWVVGLVLFFWLTSGLMAIVAFVFIRNIFYLVDLVQQGDLVQLREGVKVAKRDFAAM